LAVTVVATGALLAGAARADEPRNAPPAYGPGMMGGYGPGGYGPGMMGGRGAYGPGMMGGYGPGMMGGWGGGRGDYGPGMMGGYGRSYGHGMMGGMMGLGPLYSLDLNEQQLAKINQIQDETRRKNWSVMGKLQDERAQMRDLFLADKRDPAAIGKQAMKIAELRRQMLEAQVDAHNRVEALLSKEQRAQLRSFRRGWMLGSDE
jgi:Spy/CpxP family protein refolding chaperone